MKKHLPVDRGWAWVICLATHGLFAFVSGSFKSQGIILVELQERFPDASATSLLWIFSLSNIVNRLSGFTTGFLLSRLTHRTVACIGVLVCATALISFGYAPAIGYMYLFYGILYGLSVGMINLTVMTAYTDYFDKKKALALGITMAGSGVGTICIPPLLRTLFDNFDFSSAILIYGGVVIEMLVLACLLRPISFYKLLVKDKVNKEECQVVSAPAIVVTDAGSEGEVDKLKTASVTISTHQTFRRHSHSETSAYLKLFDPDDRLFNSTPHLQSEDGQRRRNSVLFNSTSELAESAILYSAVKDQPKTKFNWRVALRKESILMGFASLFFSSGMGVVYQCIPPLGKGSGVSKATIALVMSIAGGVEIPCRILNGVLADRKLISAITQLSLYMCLAGVAALLCASISGLAGISIMLGTMSACGTSVFSLLPIASGDLLGQDNVAMAVGINMLYQSLARLISVFSSGAIYDVLGRWELVYYFIGGAMIVGSIINGGVALYSYRIRKQAPPDNTEQ